MTSQKSALPGRRSVSAHLGPGFVMFTRLPGRDRPRSSRFSHLAPWPNLVRKPAFLRVTKPADTHFCTVSPDLQIAVENTIMRTGLAYGVRKTSSGQ